MRASSYYASGCSSLLHKAGRPADTLAIISTGAGRRGIPCCTRGGTGATVRGAVYTAMWAVVRGKMLGDWRGAVLGIGPLSLARLGALGRGALGHNPGA
jgi:hypothetical protein